MEKIYEFQDKTYKNFEEEKKRKDKKIKELSEMLILEKARTRAHEKTIGEFTKEISNSIMDSKNDDKKYIETLI